MNTESELYDVTCDASNIEGIKVDCPNPVEYVCFCSRCDREHPDRFCSCKDHVENVATKHRRVYGIEAVFKRLQ